MTTNTNTTSSAIRIAARALIIEDGKVLVIHYEDEHGRWCCTPGGGVSKLETLADALKREIHEELSIVIEIDDIVYVRELLGHTAKLLYGGLHQDFHQLEIFFRCRRQGEIAPGAKLDNFSTGYSWVPLDELEANNFFPTALAKRLKDDVKQGFRSHGNYLGDA